VVIADIFYYFYKIAIHRPVSAYPIPISVGGNLPIKVGTEHFRCGPSSHECERGWEYRGENKYRHVGKFRLLTIPDCSKNQTNPDKKKFDLIAVWVFSARPERSNGETPPKLSMQMLLSPTVRGSPAI